MNTEKDKTKGIPLKSDGTRDKRFNNKQILNKDGTKDKRFKSK